MEKFVRSTVLTIALAIVGGLFLVEEQAMARTPVIKCKSDSDCGVGWYCHRYKDCNDGDSGSCRVDLEFWKGSVGSEKARADNTERERDQARGERDQSKSELAKAGTELERLRSELEKAKANPSYKQELDGLQAKYDRIKAKYKKFKKQYARDMAAKDEDIEGLLAEISELRGELAELRAENTLIKEENRELRLELKKPTLQVFGEFGGATNAVGRKKQIQVCDGSCTLKWTEEFSVPLEGVLGLRYQFLMADDVVGIGLGLLGKFGRGARFDVYFGGGFELQLALYPEPRRILALALQARVTYERAEDLEWSWNYELGGGIGADMRTFGILLMISYQRYGFPDQDHLVWLKIQFLGRIPGTRPR